MLKEFKLQGQAAGVQVEIRGVYLYDRRAPDVW
jgi:hypothetical protein